MLAGGVVGSFLNVVIHRLPMKQSIVSPGSRCPECGHGIRRRHNIPVLGWLMLKGRCHDCDAAISLRYPGVEALTALLFLASFLVYGVQPRTPFVWTFLAALIVVAFIDIDHRIIPNKIVVPGSVIGFGASVALDPARWWQYLVAGLGASGFLLLLGMIWRGGMGMGDVKMALMMGCVLGSSVIVALFASFLIGGIGGALLIATGLRGRRDRVPFGPYLSIGGGFAALAGAPVLEWYVRSFL
ncbi:MAG: prepilin peptidase [Actinobacteria bacterium]|nr:prepilin peptidase [Actinomycetota bacterium]